MIVETDTGDVNLRKQDQTFRQRAEEIIRQSSNWNPMQGDEYVSLIEAALREGAVRGQDGEEGHMLAQDSGTRGVKKTIKNPSRPQRWAAAVQEASNAVSEALGAIEDLVAIQEEYRDWLDGLPENLQSGVLADKLNAVCDIDLSDAQSSLESAQEKVEEAEAADLPKGFGRD